MQQRKVTYRLYPSLTQKTKLEDMLGVQQRLYNKALEQRITLYKEDKIPLSFYKQCRFLTEWRASDPKLEAVNAQSEQVTLKRLDLAFQAFFVELKKEKRLVFPDLNPITVFRGGGINPMEMDGG